ncbi:MAG: DUF1292 domain-containing protein [Lachnospiraceae bacterium]|nr:DUF1292 domain-containing protein [Lachnospiraceae bacterium]
MEKITLEDADGTMTFCVLEQTVLNGKSYILVTEDEEGDAEAFVLRDDSAQADTEALYSFVEDDDELNAVGEIFKKLLEEDDTALSV